MTILYHTSNSHESMGVNVEALPLHAVYTKPYFYYKPPEDPHQYCMSPKNLYQYCTSRENLYKVLQAMRESISGTTIHVHYIWMCYEIEGSYDKILSP